MHKFCLYAFVSILSVVLVSGCGNNHRTKDIFSCTADESAHAEKCREMSATVIEPTDLELVGNTALVGEIFDLDLGKSLQIGNIFNEETTLGASHNSSGAYGYLRPVERDEQFTIEVITDLTFIADHSDIIDNGQLELDIRPEGDGARIKFLRKTNNGWETLVSQVLPLSNFLGPHTFAGRYADARMELYIDGIMVADMYSPKRTKCWAHDLEVGMTGVQGRIGRITLGPRDMDLTASLDSLLFGDEFVRGDANQDGRVDKFDVVHIQNTALGRDVACGCEEAYDVNDDGVIDAKDFITISSIVYGTSPMIEPFNVADMDYDGDDLDCFQHRMH